MLVTSLDIDDPVGAQPDLSNRWREEVLSRDAPENLACGSRDDACCKKGRRCTIDCTIPAACDFMQGSQGQPTTRQVPINDIDPERKDHTLRGRPTFKTSDLLAKLGDHRSVDGLVHFSVRISPPAFSSVRTRNMFPLCSIRLGLESMQFA